MKNSIIALAIFGLMAAPAAAANTGGIVGTVVDSSTGKALSSVPISITRVESSPRSWTTKTNAQGTFSNITLEPGQYIVVATFPGVTLGCAVDDVFEGQVVRMKILASARPQLTCSGPRVHPALVDASATADVYRMPPR